MANQTSSDTRPIVLITGAAGNLGRTLAGALAAHYRIVGLDLARRMGSIRSLPLTSRTPPQSSSH